MGKSTSIAIDSSDGVHISYFEQLDPATGYLKYATNASGSWVTMRVDSIGIVPDFHHVPTTSIAIDLFDNVHISYPDGSTGELKYAACPSAIDCMQASNWSIGTVDSSVTVGIYNSIAIDSSFKVYISYYDETNDALKYAAKTASGTTWKWAILDSGIGGSAGWGFNSIAIDRSDKVHISYYDEINDALKYATNRGVSPGTGSCINTNWNCETVTTAYGMMNSIATDSLNNVHISYMSGGDGLQYATNRGVTSGSGTCTNTNWNCEAVDSSGAINGAYNSIAIDSSNNAHISYFFECQDYIGCPEDLKYATQLPDLIVQSITTDPLSPVVGESVDVTVSLKNMGDGTARYFVVDFYKHRDPSDPPSPGDWGDVYCEDIYWLAAGATTTCERIVSYDAAGIFNMWAQVDTDQEVKESHEGNNVFGPQTISIERRITVTSPNGGEEWCAGESHDITWTSSGLGAKTYVKIEISRNKGTTWETIIPSTSNDGSHTWTATGPSTTNAVIRISSNSYSSVSDTSNGIFTIGAPGILVTSPNGGETWFVGDSQNITWDSRCLTGNSVSIEISRDKGSNWETITPSTINDGSYPWTVTGPSTTYAVIRISSTSYPASDTNDSLFTIAIRNPQPDIKANGSDGPITVSSSAIVTITVELNAGSHIGENADWWAVDDTPFDPPWFYYHLASTTWRPGFVVTYQGPLFDLSPFEVWNDTLSPGTYTIYFGVDMNMNGLLDMDQVYYDHVVVNVTP